MPEAEVSSDLLIDILLTLHPILFKIHEVAKLSSMFNSKSIGFTLKTSNPIGVNLSPVNR